MYILAWYPARLQVAYERNLIFTFQGILVHAVRAASSGASKSTKGNHILAFSPLRINMQSGEDLHLINIMLKIKKCMRGRAKKLGYTDICVLNI